MISVITVTYQAAEALQRTVDSVTSQANVEFEYVIVDGGSNDATLGVIKKNKGIITKWVSERDGGIYDAMNKGVRLSTGKYVIFMNAGDTFHDPNVLADIQRELQLGEQPLMLYGDAIIVSKNGAHLQAQKGRHLDLTKSIIHQSIFIDRQYLLANPYNVSYKIMADYDSLLSLSVSHPQALKYLERKICVYDKFGISSRPLYTYFWEYYTIALRRMPLKTWMYFNFYILPRLVFSLRHILKGK